MKFTNLILIVAFYLVIPSVDAEEYPVKIFDTNSYAKVLQANDGKEFTLIFWSLLCSPCIKELYYISESKLYESSKFVFVSVDGDDITQEVKRFLKKIDLINQEHWIFSVSQIDEIVHSVDPRWYGEVPRNYFFDEDHNRIRLKHLEVSAGGV